MYSRSSHPLTKKKSQTSTKYHSQEEQEFLLEEAEEKYAQAKGLAEARPQNADMQAQQVLEWAWLCQARQAVNDSRPEGSLPQGFIAAVRTMTTGSRVLDHESHKARVPRPASKHHRASTTNRKVVHGHPHCPHWSATRNAQAETEFKPNALGGFFRKKGLSNNENSKMWNMAARLYFNQAINVWKTILIFDSKNDLSAYGL